MVVYLSRREKVEVASLKEASARVCAFIDANGLGASDWYETGAGGVFEGETCVARISYNGKAWTVPDATEIPLA